jgi:hypothetical protein
LSNDFPKILEFTFIFSCITYYSGSHLLGSLWDREKLITLTQWFHYLNSLIHWVRPALGKWDLLKLACNWFYYPIDNIIHDSIKRLTLFITSPYFPGFRLFWFKIKLINDQCSENATSVKPNISNNCVRSTKMMISFARMLRMKEDMIFYEKYF